MNKLFVIFLCCPLLFLFGCASVNQRENGTEGVDSGRLEKRIDDLSGTITLIVNDTNRLHNKLEEVKTSNKTIQQKMEGLEVTVRNLNEQIVTLHTSAKTLKIAQPPAEKADVDSQLPVTDSSKPSDNPESDVQKTIDAESQLAVAKGFWDAMNAKDIQAVKSYVTKESAGKLRVKEKDATGNCKATFGEVKIEDNKTTVDTTMQTYDGTTELEVQMQTILVKEAGQWKVDADQTMMSMFGGAMGEMLKGLGNTMEEGLKKGMVEIGKSLAEGMQKGLEVMTQTTATSEAKPDPTPQIKSETAVFDQTGKISLEEMKQDTESKPVNIPLPTPKPETTILDQKEKIGWEESKQTSETKLDITPTKQEPAMINEPSKRESFLRDNIVRLAETEFSDNKGTGVCT